MRDDDERRPEEEVGQRGESVLALGGRAAQTAAALLDGDPWFDGPDWEAVRSVPVGVVRA